ncbi:unnamed protein product [Urochloa humidicola]
MGWAAWFLTAASFLAAGVLFVPDALGLGRPRDSAAAAVRLVHLFAFSTAWAPNPNSSPPAARQPQHSHRPQIQILETS